MKTLIVAALAISITGCASSKLPQPSGELQPVNSVSTLEYLNYKAGKVIVGPQREVQAVRTRLLTRPPDPDDSATIQGGSIVDRIMSVTFTYGSTVFKPSPEQAFNLRLLLAAADRVEIRGRTDGVANTPGNLETAKRRALSARAYLIDRGMPSELITVNYMSSGDHAASNDNPAGRAQNRRVELEFYIDDFNNSTMAENTHSTCPDWNTEWVAVGTECEQ